MPLRSAVVGRYLRYKTGTKKVVKWLAKTAGQFRDLSTYLECLKLTNTRRSTPENLEVKTCELIGLAEIIVSAEPPVGLPPDIARVLDDVIIGRQEAHEFYSAQAINDDTELADQNERHAHFISALERVKKLLTSLGKASSVKTGQASSRDSSAQASARTSTDSLTNLFEYLEVEEPDDSVLPAAIVSNAKKTNRGQTPKPREFTIEGEANDDAFAIWCFLQDLHDIRTFIKSAWKEYRQGAVSLEVAGVLSEAAVGMFERLYKEFIEVQPKYRNWGAMMQFLRLRWCVTNNVVYVYSRDDKASAKRPKDSMRVPELVCPAAYMLLSLWPIAGRRLDYNPVEVRKGRRNRKTTVAIPMDQNVDGRNAIRPLTDFEPLFLSIFPEIRDNGWSASVDRKRCHYYSRIIDWLVLYAGGAVYWNEEPASWLTMSIALCMDIHEAVGNRNTCGADGLYKCAKNIMSSIDECMDFHSHTSSELMCCHRLDIVEPTRKIASEIAQAIDLGRKQRETDLNEKDDFRRYDLKCIYPGLDSLPHTSGNLSYLLKVNAHALGTHLANDEHAILLLAHMYKAGVRHNLCQPWPDMDFVIAQHSTHKPFVTKTAASADPHAILRHYLIDLGVEASSLQRKAVLPPPSRQTVNSKAKKISITSSEFQAAMLDCYNRNELLNLKKGDHDVLETVLTALTAKKGDNVQGGGKSSKTKSSKQIHFTPTQLLSTLKANLIADEPSLNFDYLAFTRLCLKLLNRLRRETLSSAPNDMAKDPHKGVYYLLKTAADAESQGKPTRETPFAMAAEMIQDIINADGRKSSQEAFNQSSGRIPKTLRPELEKLEDLTDEKKALIQMMPGASMSDSHRIIEVYDPNGSVFDMMRVMKSKAASAVMPYGAETKKIFIWAWNDEKPPAWSNGLTFDEIWGHDFMKKLKKDLKHINEDHEKYGRCKYC